MKKSGIISRKNKTSSKKILFLNRRYIYNGNFTLLCYNRGVCNYYLCIPHIIRLYFVNSAKAIKTAGSKRLLRSIFFFVPQQQVFLQVRQKQRVYTHVNRSYSMGQIEHDEDESLCEYFEGNTLDESPRWQLVSPCAKERPRVI